MVPPAAASRPDADDLEPDLGPHALEERDVSAAAASEVEVGTDDDEPGTGRSDQHFSHELLGRLPAAGFVEVEDEAHVEEPGGLEQLQLLFRRGDELGRRLRPHDFGRVTVERDADRSEPAGVGELAHEPQDGVVPRMHPVVHADRDDRSGRGRAGAAWRRDREVAEIVDDPHHASAPETTTTAALSAAPCRS